MIKIFFVYIVILFSVSSCSQSINNHGIKYEQKNLNKLEIGQTKSYLIKHIIGPASLDISHGPDMRYLYYINSKTSQTAFFKPNYLEHNILELTFKNAILQNITEYDKSSLQKIEFVKKSTVEDGENLGILKQLLGNFRRFEQNSDL